MKARKKRGKTASKPAAPADGGAPEKSASKRARMSRPREFALNLGCIAKDIVQGPEAWNKVSFHYAGLKRSVRLK
jgi:hypothetical protein